MLAITKDPRSWYASSLVLKETRLPPSTDWVTRSLPYLKDIKVDAKHDKDHVYLTACELAVSLGRAPVWVRRIDHYLCENQRDPRYLHPPFWIHHHASFKLSVRHPSSLLDVSPALAKAVQHLYIGHDTLHSASPFDPRFLTRQETFDTAAEIVCIDTQNPTV